MTAQLDFYSDDWPRTKAHRADPPTSHTAARHARSLASRHQAIILDVLRASGPSTGHEIAAATEHRLDGAEELNREQVMRRCKEMREQGLVSDTGKTRATPSGRQAVVWRAK